MARNEELAIVVNARDQASRTLKKFGNNLDDLKEKARTFATRGLAVSSGALAALTAGTAKFIQNASGFEDAMRGVAKTTGLTGDELKDVEQGLLELNKQTPTSKEQLAQVGEEAGRLGVEGTQNILEFVRVADQIGVATDQTSAAAASNFAKILNSLNEPINRVQRLGNVVNALSNNTASSTSEIIQTMRKMGQSVNDDVDLSIEQVAALSAQFNALGQQSSRAGTRFARVLERARLPENMEKIAEATDRSVSDIEQRLGEDAIKVLREFLVETDRAGNQAEKVNEIFGAIGQRALAPLSKNFEQFQETLGETEDATGSLQEEFDSAIQSFSKQASILFDVLESQFARVGLEILPDLTDKIKEFKSEISDLDPEQLERLTNQTIALAEGILKASVFVGGLSTAILTLTSVTGSWTVALGLATVAARDLFKVAQQGFNAVRQQAAQAARAQNLQQLQNQFNAVKTSVQDLINPVNELIGKLGDGELRKESQKFRQLIGSSFEDLKKMSEEEINQIIGFTSKLRKRIRENSEVIRDENGITAEQFRGITQRVKRFEERLKSFKGTNVYTQSLKNANEEMDVQVKKIDFWSQKVTDLVNRAKDGAISIDQFIQKVKQTADDVDFSQSISTSDETKQKAETEGKKIGQAMAKGLDSGFRPDIFIDQTIDAMKGVQSETNKFTDQLSQQTEVVKGFVKASVSDYSDLTQKEFDKIVKRGKSMSQDLKKSFENVFLDGMRGEFENFGDFLEGFMRSIVNNIQKQMAQSLVQNTAIGQLVGAVSKGAGEAGSGDASGFFSSIFSFFSDTPGVMEASGGAFAHFKEDDKVAAAQNMSDLRAQVNGSGGGTTVVKKTVQNVSINAIDAKSFEQRLAESGGTINGLVNKNMRENGSTRDAMKDVM